MKTKIANLLVAMLMAILVVGCGSFSIGGSAYDHQMQGTVIRSRGTNDLEKIEYNERQKGKGPRPKGVSPHGTPSVPTPAGNSPFMPPPLPPMSSATPDTQGDPQVTQLAQADCPPVDNRLSLKHGMNAWRSTPGAPVGASVLPPKPVANSETRVNSSWTGGAYYNYQKSKGSDVNATVINGRLAASSTRTWLNTQTDVQNPPPCGYPAWGWYGGYGYGYSQPNNYYHTGSGYSYYPTSQLGPQPGNPSNYYNTGSGYGGGHGHHGYQPKSSNYY